MKKFMRLIFLGHCSFYTISNFAKAIKQNLKNVTITVADPVKPNGDELTEEDEKVFDEIIKLPSKRNIKLTCSNRIASIKDIVKDKNKMKYFLKCFFLLRWNSVKNYINGNAKNYIYSILISKQLENYDVYHFHYLAPEFLAPLKFIKKDKRVLLTLWGSDLYQVEGVGNYIKQLEAFKRSDIITINTAEMKETFLTKFGRMLEPKIRYADFGLNEKKLDLINTKNNQQTISDFKKKNNIAEDKIVVVIGYSGSSKQRHIEILRILDKLDKNILRKFFAIIPMTYGLQFEDKNYLQKVKNECNKVRFDYKIITEFMPQEDLIGLIISGQIKLNLRETDAVNAAMLESLFAGSIVVNGSWLPYGKLRRLKIYFEEVDSLDDLTNLIPYLIENFKHVKNRTINNPSLISKNFSYSSAINDWIKVYNEINTNKNKFKIVPEIT